MISKGSGILQRESAWSFEEKQHITRRGRRVGQWQEIVREADVT